MVAMTVVVTLMRRVVVDVTSGCFVDETADCRSGTLCEAAHSGSDNSYGMMLVRCEGSVAGTYVCENAHQDSTTSDRSRRWHSSSPRCRPSLGHWGSTFGPRSDHSRTERGLSMRRIFRNRHRTTSSRVLPHNCCTRVCIRYPSFPNCWRCWRAVEVPT